MKVNIGKYPKKSQRKVNIDIDNFDSWSLDHTLALVIFPALLQLKQTHHGIPNEFADVGGDDNSNSQTSFDFYKETHDEAFNLGCRRWEETLDKMIWSFYQIIVDDDSKYHHGTMKFDWVKSDKTYPNPVTGKIEPTWQMLDKNPKDHWYDLIGHMEHQKRIQEGLELFGKYYQSLWD